MAGPEKHWEEVILTGADPDTSAGMLVCDPLTDVDVEDAALLYVDVFLNDEPTTVTRAPDPDRFLHFSRLYARYLPEKNLSFIARDERSHKIAGFIFCIDITDSPENIGEQAIQFLEEFKEVTAMIDGLEHQYFDIAKIVPGTVLHIFQIGVGRKYRGRGVGHALIQRALGNGRERGFGEAVAECTNPGSRKSFEGCGFHEAGFSSYKEFSKDSDWLFAGLAGGISLMVRGIGPDKN